MKVILQLVEKNVFFSKKKKKRLLLFCPSYQSLGWKYSLNSCAAFSKVAKWGCMLHSRKQGPGLVRPHTQLFVGVG